MLSGSWAACVRRAGWLVGLLWVAGCALAQGGPLAEQGRAEQARAGLLRPSVTRLELPDPAAAIFIGNSFFYYNNSLHTQVARLAASGESRLRLEGVSVTISGSGADWHDVESYFRPDAIGTYTFDRDNNIVFKKPGARLFDVAIMMDCSQCPIHPQLKDLSRETLRKNAQTVRSHGAQPVYFMSWAYADRPEMTAALANAYTAIGNENGALVIPAGLAFARSVALKPELNLYAPDKRHPSPAGTYLAACAVYAALYGRSPVGLAYTAGLEPATVLHLQTVAWEAVRAYYGAS